LATQHWRRNVEVEEMTMGVRPTAGRSREVWLQAPEVTVDHRPDGTIYLNPVRPLAPYADRLTERLVHWAARTPDRTFLAQRDERGEWRRISYAQTLDHARRIGAALLDRSLSAERPLMILSGNDIEHALLGLGALHVGVAYVPVSPAYALVSTDFAKLRHLVTLTTPGLVYAADGQRFGRAIATAIPDDIEVVTGQNAVPGRSTTTFAALLAVNAGNAVDTAHAAVGPDTVAKILFTSGSTGMPKGVINTHRMLCANMEQVRSHFPFLRESPPVLLDWSPWHHTAGGNHDFNLILYNGGTFYIDDGNPTPQAIEATVRNLRDVAPTWYFNVPRGYDALIPYLRDDRGLRENFFRDLLVMYYAGAGMAQHTWDALDEIATSTYGERILMLTGLGSTETAPFALTAGAGMNGAGLVGLPACGVQLKLAPVEGKLEARVRGPNITPGYWRQPDLTTKAFDDEGYYCFGDALKFADPTDVRKGLLFDGRVAEDFKLTTGTWVSVGPLRLKLIEALAPYAHDVVLAGPNRDQIGALVFPNLTACKALAGTDAADAASIVAHPAVRREIGQRLAAFAAKSTGSSNRVARVLILDEPPSIDRGEATDKGSLNQRAVLANRAALVERLYASPMAPEAILAER
jgi:feruloyl-CoA synthase